MTDRRQDRPECRLALRPGMTSQRWGISLLLLVLVAAVSRSLTPPESPSPTAPSLEPAPAAPLVAPPQPAPTAPPTPAPLVVADLPAEEQTVAATRPTAPHTTAPAAIPIPQPPSLYELAARQYGLSPQTLRALHAVESSLAEDGCILNLEGSGATGPFQFMPATFRAYGLDADGDGVPNICSFADSLFSAAHYLDALGADSDPDSPASRQALERYGTDVDRVVALAR